MAVLERTLMEEYERLHSRLENIDTELKRLPKGYISKKCISDKNYYYLQRREQKKIVSEYLKADQVEQMRRMIAYRKMLEGERKDLLKEFDRVRKILGIYTQEEKIAVIKEGVDAAERGDARDFREVFAEIREEIINAKKIQCKAHDAGNKMD